ncbi:MAG: CRISPR-associated endonuclease Cas3'' [Chloroflexi bacterium]|nr:CRISPR-associated endonuclease Cas3'' [Chloroflexota bacterium]
MAQRDKEYKRLELLFKMLIYYMDQAYSDVELGIELETDRSNIWRIRGIMAGELEIPIQESPEQPGKYFIRKDFQMRYIHFSPEEMASLYLAARRLQQQTKTSQEPVALALKKLANAMRKPFAERLIMAAQTVTSQEQDAQQELIFSTLVECWLEQVPVRITHRKLHGQSRTYYVEPYQIEPSVWGDGNYLIGKSDYHKGLATFKLARIEKAVKATGRYTIPPDFNIHDLLKYAWGVWHADEEPVTVKLRFNKYVTPRVSETLWHPQQAITQHEDGSCTWQVQVSGWKEMESWVRGWGSNVKVEEPANLLAAIENEVRRLVKLYAVAELPAVPTYQLLWAKTSKDKQRTHPLICHLIDVGQAALALWKFAFPDSLRRHMARLMNMKNDLDAAGRTLAFWIALHDLGKASPAFQRLHKPAIEVLEAAKLSFPLAIDKQKVWHATITAVTLDTLLSPALSPRTRKKIAQALGGHHGSWPSVQLLGDYRDVERMVGNQDWQAIRAELVNVLQTCFQPSDLCNLNQEQTEFNSFLTLFSGMTTVADWIGSMEEYFS